VTAGKPIKTLFLWAFNDMEYSMIFEKKQEKYQKSTKLD